jgi:hypothetical protein
MTKVLLKSLDEKCVKAAIEKYGKRDIYVALDETIANRQIALSLGLDRYALVGVDADSSAYDECDLCKKPAPAKKAEKPKKVEAKKDDKPKSE